MTEYSATVSVEKVPSPRPPKFIPNVGKFAVENGLEEMEHSPKKHVMVPVHTLLSWVMGGTRTHFEKGAREEIAEHRDAGGSFLLLMTHFRRWEIPAIAQISRVNRTLQHLQYRTGITSRREMGELPVVGYIVRNSGCQFIDRSYENIGETAEGKKARQQRNLVTLAGGADFMNHTGNWLMYGDGGSKEFLLDEEGEKVIGPDDKPVRVARRPGVSLPIQMGFVHLLGNMTTEQRARVRIMGIAAHYGDRPFTYLRPTIAIPRLITPLEGDYSNTTHQERVRQQGQDLYDRGIAHAVALDAHR